MKLLNPSALPKAELIWHQMKGTAESVGEAVVFLSFSTTSPHTLDVREVYSLAVAFRTPGESSRPPPSLHPHKKGGHVVTPHNGRSTARAGQAVTPSTARAGRVPHTVPWMLSGEACKRRLGAEGSFGRGGQRRHPPCSLWVCRLRWPLFLRHRPRPIPLQLQPDRGAPSPRQDGLGPAYRAPNPAESREDQARLAAGAH